MTAARKLAEAWEKYRECLADPYFKNEREGDRALWIVRVEAEFANCTRLAHQILTEEE